MLRSFPQYAVMHARSHLPESQNTPSIVVADVARNVADPNEPFYHHHSGDRHWPVGLLRLLLTSKVPCVYKIRVSAIHSPLGMLHVCFFLSTFLYNSVGISAAGVFRPRSLRHLQGHLSDISNKSAFHWSVDASGPSNCAIALFAMLRSGFRTLSPCGRPPEILSAFLGCLRRGLMCKPVSSVRTSLNDLRTVHARRPHRDCPAI
ncbi:hypothetical protein PYCCODRAFT_1109632 [Trametes coccinea BRFM310]|uniref:Uncharacterized protein n=1 Tax=Trametes coccinea (strain BRFM310) TaxID=1353009 RepID=A0A1Y2IAI3_TRAC3|nr:hypothetical protein PYCCODRAFT_1109632 [Trametes coccinea BRFM310]